MTTALIVVGCILLFFIFLFTVHAFITLDMAEDMALTVRVLFIRIKILPKKDKTYNPKNYTLKKIRKRDAKAAAKDVKSAEKKRKKQADKAEKKAEKKAKLAAMSKEERRELKRRKKASRPALTDLIPLVCRVLGLFCSRFFGKLHIKVARLNVRIGAADAAQAAVMYGVVNQSVQYLMEGFRKFTHVDGLRKAEINVTPDFLSDKIDFDFKLTVRVSLGNVLGAVFKAGWKFLVGYIRIKPNPDRPRANGTKPPKPPKAPKVVKVPRPEPAPRPEKRA